ncbi:MAG: hypothetical protein Q8Q01_01415 [archaeon]|nr:hypothetical protein [archaeon]
MIYKSPEERRIRKLTEWEERVSREISPKLEFLKEGARNSLFKIPISYQIYIKYHETHMHALVAKLEDFQDGLLVYVESGSQHDDLRLYQIPKVLTEARAEPVRVIGSYERISKRIESIFIPRDAILSASYQGTFEDLITNPNISLRLPEDKNLAEKILEEIERLTNA